MYWEVNVLKLNLVITNIRLVGKIKPVINELTADPAVIRCSHCQKQALLKVALQKKGLLISLKTYFVVYVIED